MFISYYSKNYHFCKETECWISYSCVFWNTTTIKSSALMETTTHKTYCFLAFIKIKEKLLHDKEVHLKILVYMKIFDQSCHLQYLSKYVTETFTKPLRINGNIQSMQCIVHSKDDESLSSFICLVILFHVFCGFIYSYENVFSCIYKFCHSVWGFAVSC